jgi:hypothetical protein
VVVGVHNLSGLQDSLGKERASEVFDLCTLKAFFRAGNADTAKLMAEHFGTVREIVKQTTTGTGWNSDTSVTHSEVDRPVLLDEAFLNLPLPKYDPVSGQAINLAGYYRIAGVPGQPGSFYSELPMSRLYGPGGMIQPIAPGHDFRERPKWQQDHIPFTSEEFQELLGEPTRKRNAKSAISHHQLPVGTRLNLFKPRDDG